MNVDSMFFYRCMSAGVKINLHLRYLLKLFKLVNFANIADPDEPPHLVLRCPRNTTESTLNVLLVLNSQYGIA